MKTDDAANHSDREIVITRLVRAPRELVFRAFSEPEHITHWWGPRGFTTTTHAMDFRPGGIWRFTMHGPDGTDYQNRIEYVEIVRPERLTYRHAGEEAHKDVAFHTTASFTETGDGTTVELRMVFASASERDRVEREYGAVEGGQQTLARLAELVESQK